LGSCHMLVVSLTQHRFVDNSAINWHFVKKNVGSNAILYEQDRSSTESK